MRDIIYQALSQDSDLETKYGIKKVLVNNQFEETPHDSPFLVIKYNNQILRSRGFGRGPVEVQVWAHCPVELGRDYIRIEDALQDVKQIMFSISEASDADWRITDIHSNGLSSDLIDEGFHTLTKHASFEVLAHRVR